MRQTNVAEGLRCFITHHKHTSKTINTN